jgi:hypothetical protein
MLKIVEYAPEPRDKVAITLLCDFDARPHEVTALSRRYKDIEEQYAENTIPYNTKTGGGPILLRGSFPYVRDWLNQDSSKNEPLIHHLHNGKSINPDAIWRVMNRLRLRIKRLVESGSTENEERQKREYLFRTKKWNPYCFRHSGITNDSHYLTEYDLKRVRWTIGSIQGARYIKPNCGLEWSIRPAPQSATSGKCQHVNKFESKYCEHLGCAYPLTQQVFEERKKSRLTEIVNERLKDKDKEVRMLGDELMSMKSDVVSAEYSKI